MHSSPIKMRTPGNSSLGGEYEFFEMLDGGQCGAPPATAPLAFPFQPLSFAGSQPQQRAQGYAMHVPHMYAIHPYPHIAPAPPQHHRLVLSHHAAIFPSPEVRDIDPTQHLMDQFHPTLGLDGCLELTPPASGFSSPSSSLFFGSKPVSPVRQPQQSHDPTGASSLNPLCMLFVCLVVFPSSFLSDFKYLVHAVEYLGRIPSLFSSICGLVVRAKRRKDS